MGCLIDSSSTVAQYGVLNTLRAYLKPSTSIYSLRSTEYCSYNGFNPNIRIMQYGHCAGNFTIAANFITVN